MIYDRFYDTSEKTLYFQCFWPFFRGFKSRLAHQNPESFGSRVFLLPSAFHRRKKAPCGCMGLYSSAFCDRQIIP